MKKAWVNGFELAYRDEGAGLPVLMVHGFPLSSLMWNPQVEYFKRDYRLIVPDLRGFGHSAAGAPQGQPQGQPPDRYLSVEDYADDLAALLQTLGLEQVVFMGLSMGGYIAFAFYRKYPQMVRALVLADTRSEADSPEGRAGRYQLIETVRAQGPAAAVEILLPKLLAPATYGQRPDLVAELSRQISSAPPAGLIAAAGGLAERPDVTAQLGQIKVPTLVIVGKDDTLTPADGARRMARAIPDWQLSVVPHAGHMSNLENPEFFNQALETFLRGLDKS